VVLLDYKDRQELRALWGTQVLVEPLVSRVVLEYLDKMDLSECPEKLELQVLWVTQDLLDRRDLQGRVEQWAP